MRFILVPLMLKSKKYFCPVGSITNFVLDHDPGVTLAEEQIILKKQELIGKGIVLHNTLNNLQQSEFLLIRHQVWIQISLTTLE